MPLPVKIGNPVSALGLLPDLPNDLIILCYTLTQFTAIPLALRGQTVLNHFLRQPISSGQFDFRLTGAMAYNHLNNLKDVAKYSNNTIYLNNQSFKIFFFEGEGGPVFRLIGQNHNHNHNLTVNVYEANQLNDYPLRTFRLLIKK